MLYSLLETGKDKKKFYRPLPNHRHFLLLLVMLASLGM